MEDGGWEQNAHGVVTSERTATTTAVVVSPDHPLGWTSCRTSTCTLHRSITTDPGVEEIFCEDGCGSWIVFVGA